MVLQEPLNLNICPEGICKYRQISGKRLTVVNKNVKGYWSKLEMKTEIWNKRKW